MQDIKLNAFTLKTLEEKNAKADETLFVFHKKTGQCIEVHGVIGENYVVCKDTDIEEPLTVSNCLTLEEYKELLKKSEAQKSEEPSNIKAVDKNIESNKQEDSNKKSTKTETPKRKPLTIKEAKIELSKHKDLVALLYNKKFTSDAYKWGNEKTSRNGKIKSFGTFMEFDINKLLPNYIVDYINYSLDQVKFPKELLLTLSPKNQDLLRNRIFNNRKTLKEVLSSLGMKKDKVTECLEKCISIGNKYPRSLKTLKIVAAMQVMENKKVYRKVINYLVKKDA